MPAQERKQTIVTWGIIFAIAIGYILWALLVQLVIGYRELTWQFGIIPDIPGESAYSTFSPTRPLGFTPNVIPVPAEPQHVMGPGPETPREEIPSK